MVCTINNLYDQIENHHKRHKQPAGVHHAVIDTTVKIDTHIGFEMFESEIAKKANYVSQRHFKSRRRRMGIQGFTLVEILVVITIIGLIMALVGPRVLNYLSDSKVKTTKIQIESFKSALDLFYLDTGRYPSTSEGLAALLQSNTGISSWNGPYLKGSSVPTDPWGHPYTYRAPGEHGPYDIVSFGADGEQGGSGNAADITSWSQ